jgi:Ribosomal L18 C-terminal region
MTALKGDTDAFNKQFSQWAKCLKAAGVATVDALFTKIHAAIRANSARAGNGKKAKTAQKYEDAAKTIIVTKNGKYTRDRKITLEQRKARLQQKIKDAVARLSDN